MSKTWVMPVTVSVQTMTRLISAIGLSNVTLEIDFAKAQALDECRIPEECPGTSVQHWQACETARLSSQYAAAKVICWR